MAMFARLLQIDHDDSADEEDDGLEIESLSRVILNIVLLIG